MTALQKTDDAALVDYGSGVLGVIERALGDPATGVETLERLFALQERVMAASAKQQFTAAKIAMRPELPEVTMKGHIVIRDKNDPNKIIQDTPHSRLEDLQEAVMPVLTEHGFDLKFKNGLAPDGKVRVTTILVHIGGHEDETHFDLLHDGSGSKNSVQAVGSSTKYGMRYGIISILNIKVIGGDDDGSSASYKDVSGEPLARTKLDGPIESKTALKAAVQAIRYKVGQTANVEALDTLLKSEKAVIDQAERDWTALLTGYPDIPEDRGLRGDVADRRAFLKGNASKIAHLLSGVRGCQNMAALYSWRDENEAEVDSLDGADAREFQRAWDDQEAIIANKPTALNAG